jgi:hypothetical protein
MLFAPLAIFAGCGTRLALNEKLEKLSAAHEDEWSTPRFGAMICKVDHPTPPHNIRCAGAAAVSQLCRCHRQQPPHRSALCAALLVQAAGSSQRKQ